MRTIIFESKMAASVLKHISYTGAILEIVMCQLNWKYGNFRYCGGSEGEEDLERPLLGNKKEKAEERVKAKKWKT